MAEKHSIKAAFAEEIWYRYSKAEIRAGWAKSFPFVRDKNAPNSVVVPCTEEQALELTALFLRAIYPIPHYTYYDGTFLYLHCGQVGRESIVMTRSLVENYLLGKLDKNFDRKGPLFCTD